MTKSELMEKLSAKQPTLPAKEIENMVKDILEFISQSLEKGDRVEVRGFGSFSLHHRQPRLGRNPKTGDSVNLSAKSVPYFKAGKELKALSGCSGLID
ncbi:integration host factor subunit beta [Haemophilus influenzae biotype aegyptius]|nr:integration host factor subunit beta [Haemophilus influenzae biotype aegyptius]